MHPSTDLAVRYELVGKVARIGRATTETLTASSTPSVEDAGWVDVELGPLDPPRTLRVPFPLGVPFGLRLGQSVSLVFQGFDPESPIDQLVAENTAGGT